MPLICFASPKGGVGKTTLAANVADALQRRGRRVLAIDFDAQNALRLHFALPITDTSGFMSQLPQRPDWRTLVRRTSSGVFLLPHGATDVRGALNLAQALDREPELLAAPMREILADPNLVVIADTPPGASHALSILAPMSNMVCAVLLADATSAALVPEISNGSFLGGGTMANLMAGRLCVILNGIEPKSRLSRAVSEMLTRHLGPRLLGAICREEMMAEAVAAQRFLLDVAPGSQAALDLQETTTAIEAALGAAPELFAARGAM
nr:cellulose synthase operon protein YhjQ/BcsQ [uncultured Roseococcus sp.]